MCYIGLVIVLNGILFFIIIIITHVTTVQQEESSLRVEAHSSSPHTLQHTQYWVAILCLSVVKSRLDKIA